MIKKYRISLLFNKDLQEKEFQEHLSFLENKLEGQGCKIGDYCWVGEQKLQKAVQKYNTGILVIMNITVPHRKIQHNEGNLKSTQELLIAIEHFFTKDNSKVFFKVLITVCDRGHHDFNEYKNISRKIQEAEKLSPKRITQ